jgi:hypothetical protein
VVRHLAHRKGGQALGVGDRHAGGDDIGKAGTRLGSAYRGWLFRRPQQFDDSSTLRSAGLVSVITLASSKKLSVARAWLISVQRMLF